jgi:hypothetical protein
MYNKEEINMYIKPFVIEKNNSGDVIVITTEKSLNIESEKATLIVDNEPIVFHSLMSPQWCFKNGFLFCIGVKDINNHMDSVTSEVDKVVSMKFGDAVQNWKIYSDEIKPMLTLGEIIDNMISWYHEMSGKMLVSKIGTFSPYRKLNKFEDFYVETWKSFSSYFIPGTPYLINWGSHPKKKEMSQERNESYSICVSASGGSVSFVTIKPSFTDHYRTYYCEVRVRDVYAYNMMFYRCYNHIQMLDLIDQVKTKPESFKGKSEYTFKDDDNQSQQCEFTDYIHDDDEERVNLREESFDESCDT